jgi:hypothetical protein
MQGAREKREKSTSKVGNCEREQNSYRSKGRRKNAIKGEVRESGRRILGCVYLVRDNNHWGLLRKK